MSWDEKTEELFKSLIYSVSKKTTANMLNIVDGMKENESITLGECRRLDGLKRTLRSAVMNFQGELLTGAKSIVDCGELPLPIDRRDANDNN